MPQWTYSPAADLGESWLRRLRRFPREPDVLVHAVRSVAALAVRGWLACWHRLRLSGRDRLPPRGPFILAANHASHLDALALSAVVPIWRTHHVFPCAAEDYFFSSAGRTVVSAVALNALPFRRQGSARGSLDACLTALADPQCVLIVFPEGTRSPDGRIGPFRAGIGMLALRSGVPVVPCRLVGAAEALPKGRVFPRPVPMTVHVGVPLTWPPVARPEKEAAEDVAARVREAVLALGE